MTSTATIRTTNIKESKEKRNREKLLAGPGSEFSLANTEDFELDYYDYNVINAGAAPGSYLGMDPAYLVWIPPLDGGDIIQEIDESEEIPPKRNLSKGNVACKMKVTEEIKNVHSPTMCKNEKNSKISKMLVAQSLGECNSKLDATSKTSCAEHNLKSPTSDDIQMNDFGTEEPDHIPGVDRRTSCTSLYHEKETAEVKRDFYELDDIQFADDEDDTVPNCDSICFKDISKIGKIKNTYVTHQRR